MKLSVAICTRNRARSLARALDSLTRMRIPDGLDWELVVVNNNSADETDRVIADYRDRLPIRREFEPKTGISNARNRAVAAVRGDYVVWTDDDVIVDEDWLAAYAAAFQRWPDAAVFGGRIIPEFEAPAPRWVEEAWSTAAAAYAFRDFGEEPVPLTVRPEGGRERRMAYGANFAVRTDEQRARHYDPGLGAGSDDAWFGGEETHLITSILLAGRAGYWLPGPKIRHCTPKERLRLDYIWTHYLRAGRYDAWSEQQDPVRRAAGATFWLWRRTFFSAMRFWLRRCVSGPAVWLPCMAEYARHRGALDYWRRNRKLGRAEPEPVPMGKRAED